MYTSLLSANWLKYFAFCDSCEWSGQIHPETVALELGNKARISESKRNPKGSSRPVRRASLLPSGEAVARCVFKTHLTASSLSLSLSLSLILSLSRSLSRANEKISISHSSFNLASHVQWISYTDWFSRFENRTLPRPREKKIISKLALDAGVASLASLKKKRRVTVCQGGARPV